MRTWIRGRLLPALALFLSFAGAAHAQRFTALIDLDTDASTGCTVATAAGSVTGIEWRVTATVTGDNPPVVSAVERAQCVGAAFGAPIAQPGSYAVGLNNGTAGADVVESAVTLADLAPFGTQARVYALAQDGALADLTGAVVATGLGGGSGNGQPVLIPSLHWFGISLLVFGLLLLARRSNALRGTAAVLLLLGAGLVYAANFAADGAVADWTGETADATDPAGDAGGNARIDLRAFWVAVENGRLFFRFDVAELQNLPDAPVAVDDAFVVAEDAVLNGNVVNGSGSGGVADSDPDNDPLTTSVAVQPASGTLVLNANGTFTYTPAANFNGTVTFTYTLSDGSASDTAVVTISVTPVNDAPVAVADSYGVSEDTPLVVAAPGVLGNDTDIDNNPLTATLGTAPANGTLVLQANGGFTYTPNANYTGADSFTYTAGDGTATSAPVTVSLTVGGNNDLPVAVDDNYTVAEDGTLAQAAPGVLANDTDGDGDTLTAALAANVANGVLAFNPDGSFSYAPNADFNGTDTFSYTVSDGNGGMDAGSVTLTVTPVNDVPAAAADAFSTAEDTPLANLAVTGNDTLGDRPFTITGFQNPSAQGGTVTLNGDGTFNYSPAANFTGTDTFTYTVTDADGETDTGTVTITVSMETDPPVAVADSYTVAEGGTLAPAAPGVLGNDTDPDGDTLTAVLVTGPANGTLALNADGSFSYTHDGGETTSDSFSYRANDGGNNSNAVVVTITVTPVNDLPVAVADSYNASEDTALVVAAPGVLANDSDAEGAVTAVLVGNPASGTLALAADGSFTYTPNADFTGSDSFTYTARDAAGADSAVTTVSITVAAFNDLPVAGDDSYTLAEDNTLVQAAPGVLANDSDPEGTPLTVTIVSGPANAAAFSLNADGSFTYQPAANFNGSDGFTYQASDGAGTATATVTLTVTAVNDAPSATADVFATVEDEPYTTTSLLANDGLGDPPTTISAIDATGTGGGSLAAAGGNTYTYTPLADFQGADVFAYTIMDSDGETSSSTVTFNVGAVNDVPVAFDDTASVAEGGTVNAPAPGVLGNDTDTETAPAAMTAVLVSGPANGTLTLNPDGSYTYVHDGSETTSDSFTYRANDGAADSNTATVAITVTPVNDAPVAVADGIAVDEGGSATLLVGGAGSVLTNDSDAEGNPMTAALVSGPANGTLVLNADGTFTYVHDGSETTTDSFTYRANDGTDNSNVVTVTIAIAAVNDLPLAAGDSYTLNEGGTLVVGAPGVLANDTDADDSLAAVLLTGPTNGALTLNPDGSFTYVHDGSETTADSFTYAADDGSVQSGSATVSLTIGAQNDAPVALDDAGAIGEGGTLVAPSVLANDSDAENDPITASLVTGPANGTLTLNADGTWTYVHDGGGSLTDSFTYRAIDSGAANSNVATVTITITPVNDAPVAGNDSAAVNEGGTLNGPSVLSNDTDEENDPLTAVLDAGPANAASFALNADGSYTYVHDGGETATDSFTYHANDGALDSNIATVSITVNPVDDPPVAVDDAATVLEDAAATAIDVLFNDTDVDAGPRLIASATAPTSGSVVLTGGSPGAHTGLTYQPAANFCGTDGFTYTINGGSTATVSVTVTCVNDPPVADDEAFDVIGNTELRVDLAGTPSTPHTVEATGTGLGVRDGDADPIESHPTSVTSIVGCADIVAPYDCVLPNATVSMNVDGTFRVIPGTAVANGSPTVVSFDYVLTDAPPVGEGTAANDTGTVTLNVYNKIWYVDAGAPGGGNGQSHSPLNSFAAISAGGDADGNGDIIFVHHDAATLASSLELEANQRLWGEGFGLSLPVNLNGNGSPTTLVAAGTQPAVSGTLSILNQVPAEIRGLALTGATDAINMTSNAALGGSATLAIEGNTFTGAAGEGFDFNINAGTTGTLAVSIQNNTWNAAGTHTGSAIDVAVAAATINLTLSNNSGIKSNANGISLARTGGALNILGFANNSIHPDTAGTGISVAGATFDGTPGGTFQQVNAGNTAIGASGNGVGASGIVLSNVAGDLSFADLDVFADNGAAVTASGGTPFTGSAGFQLVTAATSTFVATNGPALEMTLVTANVQAGSITSTNSATTGVNLVNVAGTVNLPAGAIANATGFDFNIGGGSANVTYNGTIYDNAGPLVGVSSTTGGNKFFGGAIDDLDGVLDPVGGGAAGNGGGISLVSNTGATIRFHGGLQLSTGPTPAFAATGGGTVEVCDETACDASLTGGLLNVITTTSATALNVTSTAIGAGGLEFRSITAGTGVASAGNGIHLDGTGTAAGNGGLQVKGTGTAGSGGTIQRKTGADGDVAAGNGIFLRDTKAVSLDRMQLNDFDNFAIQGRNVHGFTLRNSVLNGVNGTNDAFDEGVIRFGVTNPAGTNGLQGAGLIENVRISGGREHNVQFYNQTGAMALTVRGTTVINENDPALPGDDVADCIIEENTAAAGSDGILMEMQGTATASLTVRRCLFRDNKSQAIQVNALDTSDAVVVVEESRARRFDQGNEGVLLANASNSDVTTRISANQFNGFGGTSIFVGQGPGNATAQSELDAVVSGNTVNQPANGTNHGIIFFPTSTVGQVSLARVQIANNTVVNNTTTGTPRGLLVDTPDTNTSPDFDSTVTGNNVAIGDNVNGVVGLVVQSRQSANGCMSIGTNTTTFPNGVPPGINGLRARQVAPATANLEQTAACTGTAASVLACRNPAATTELLGTIGVVAQGACQLPVAVP